VSIQRLLNPHESPLNCPVSRTPANSAICSSPQRGINRGQQGSTVERDPVAASPPFSKAPVYLPTTAAPRRPICWPPSISCGTGEQLQARLWWGEGGWARTYSSEQRAVVRRRGNKPRFPLPSPTPQEFGVMSFPLGKDSTAVLPRGFPGPGNLPGFSSSSKGFAPHRLPGEEQRSWEPAIPGSGSFLNVPEGPKGNPDAWQC